MPRSIALPGISVSAVLPRHTHPKSSASASFATLAEFGPRSIPANYTALRGSAIVPPPGHELGSRHDGGRRLLPRADRRDRTRGRASLVRRGDGLRARRHLPLLGGSPDRRLRPRGGGADLLAARARMRRAPRAVSDGGDAAAPRLLCRGGRHRPPVRVAAARGVGLRESRAGERPQARDYVG